MLINLGFIKKALSSGLLERASDRARDKAMKLIEAKKFDKAKMKTEQSARLILRAVKVTKNRRKY